MLEENAFEPEYFDYIRNPANGYVSQPLPVDEGRGNEFNATYDTSMRWARLNWE